MEAERPRKIAVRIKYLVFPLLRYKTVNMNEESIKKVTKMSFMAIRDITKFKFSKEITSVEKTATTGPNSKKENKKTAGIIAVPKITLGSLQPIGVSPAALIDNA